MEGAAQAVESLGTEVVVRKDWKVVAEEAQTRWAPEEVVARPPETLVGEKPRWQKSNPGREEAGVALRWRLSRGKSVPHDTGHQLAGGYDDLGKSPSG